MKSSGCPEQVARGTLSGRCKSWTGDVGRYLGLKAKTGWRKEHHHPISQRTGVVCFGKAATRSNLEDGMHQQLLPLAVRGLWRGSLSTTFNLNLTCGSSSRQSKTLTATTGPFLRPSPSPRFSRPALVAFQSVRFCSCLSQQSLNMASDRDVLPDTYAIDISILEHSLTAYQSEAYQLRPLHP